MFLVGGSRLSVDGRTGQRLDAIAGRRGRRHRRRPARGRGVFSDHGRGPFCCCVSWRRPDSPSAISSMRETGGRQGRPAPAPTTASPAVEAPGSCAVRHFARPPGHAMPAAGPERPAAPCRPQPPAAAGSRGVEAEGAARAITRANHRQRLAPRSGETDTGLPSVLRRGSLTRHATGLSFPPAGISKQLPAVTGAGCRLMSSVINMSEDARVVARSHST